MKNRMNRNGVFAVVALSVALGGCASTPAPKDEIAVSKTAINAALSAGGAEYAPVPLKTARDKADRAEKIVASGDNDKYLQAKQLAEQAAADARVAEVTAEAAKVKKSLDETQRDQRAIIQEVDRQK